MTALVLSAGGMFAAWEAGFWKVLSERFQPDLIVGTSAGGWNGWSIAGGATPADLIAEWTDPRTAGIMQWGPHRAGCLCPEALHAKAQELFARYRPRLPFGLTLTELPRLRQVVVCGGEITWRHLAASASIPLCFPPVEIGGRRYVDGGFRGSLPLWAAEAMGATQVIALQVLTTLPFRALRMVMRSRQPGPAVSVVQFEPSQPLGSLRDAAVWSSANIHRWIELGERDARAASLPRL
ncbi:MAG TPA: patatin-like phospholipase family protein [Bryobacteraceae bacterium]|nr:patatin-like phospholipase family protein [Bryobacteraceae bacterium]